MSSEWGKAGIVFVIMLVAALSYGEYRADTVRNELRIDCGVPSTANVTGDAVPVKTGLYEFNYGKHTCLHQLTILRNDSGIYVDGRYLNGIGVVSNFNRTDGKVTNYGE